MEKIIKFKLTDDAIYYLKKIITEMNLSLPIKDNTLDKIVNYVVLNYETGLLDDEYNMPIKGFEVEHRKATDFVSEITRQWNDEKSAPDFDDLNERLASLDNG